MFFLLLLILALLATMFKIAKQMRKERRDIVGSKYLRDENGTLKVKEEKIMER